MNALGWLKSKKKSIAKIASQTPILGPQLSQEEIVSKRAALLQSKAPVDVRELMELYTVEELCDTAEDYYRNATDTTGLLAKPYVCMAETPELLAIFSQLLLGIKPVAGLDILDFGAGPGWASHALTSLGAKMILSDVSESGLKIAAERFNKNPIFGTHVPPKYLHFNGRKLDLPDASVDRIICIDAFHHIPNPAEVLAEMARILRSGGIAAFAEPGPKHSWSPGAQYEMRHHQVVENDVVVEDIWEMAKQVGFGDIRFAVFSSSPLHVSLDEFNEFLEGGKTCSQYLQTAKHYMQNSRRLFFLTKGEARPLDSRSGEGLNASISIGDQELMFTVGTSFKLSVTVRNTGTAYWLPSSQGLGSVWLGIHLHNSSENSTKVGFFTCPLPIDETDGLMPGRSVTFEVELEAMETPGKYSLEFDLVSQQIAWFHSCGSKTIQRRLEVVS